MKYLRGIGVAVLMSLISGLGAGGSVMADEPPPASIDLNTWPDYYHQGSGETLYFQTHGLSEHAILVYEAYDLSQTPEVQLKEFLGLAGSYRGGFRFIPATALNKLGAGHWRIRVSMLNSDVEASAFLAVVKAQAEVLEPDIERTATEADDEAETPPADDPTTLPEPPEVDIPPFVGPIGKGFTDFKTSPDSRVIYVPSGGNIRAGYDQLRDGYPDHLLLEAGGKYRLGGQLDWTKSGRSASEPMVMGVIGPGNRPYIDAPGGFVRTNGAVSHVAFSGLHLQPSDRDPSKGNVSATAAARNAVGFDFQGSFNNIRVEDCLIEYFAWNIMVTADHVSQRNVYIHRCIVRRSYRDHHSGHSSGIYGSRVSGLFVTECLLDHNGWDPRVSGADRHMFNHNAYIWGARNLVFERNIITRGALNGLNPRTGWHDSESLINVIIRDNFFAENANGVGIGSKTKEVQSRNLIINDNVFTQLGGTLQGGLKVSGAFNITSFDGFEAKGNLFFDKPHVSPSYCINLESHYAPLRNGVVSGNFAYQWHAASHFQIRGSNVTASGNHVDPPASHLRDPGRTVSTYLKLHGRSGETAHLAEWLGSRPRGVWDDNVWRINDYFREGFSFKF